MSSLSGEIRLWRAVLEQAVKDYENPLRLDDDTPLEDIRADAEQFLAEFAPLRLADLKRKLYGHAL